MAQKLGSIHVFEEAEITNQLPLTQEVVDHIREAFTAYSSGKASMPPVMQINVTALSGQTCVKSAYIEGVPGFAVKVSSIFPQNPAGISPRNGLFILFNAKTGAVDTIFLDNGYLTQLRTAAAGAVSTDILARKDARRLCVVGAGLQAYMQVQATCLVRPIDAIEIWARDEAKAKMLAEKLGKETGIHCQFNSNLASAVSNADILLTTTSSRTPLVSIDMVKPGLHITAMGSDAPGKTELDPAIAEAATSYSCDSIAQCQMLGELQHTRSKIAATEIGDIITGDAVGRQSDKDITVADLTGIGTQDTYIALYARALLSKEAVK